MKAVEWLGDEGTIGERDRFGIRPFYYARIDGGVVWSESLEAVLAHPGVDATQLDEAAVADYLIHEVCLDASSTVYAHVRRLPPAHVLRMRGGELAVERYWSFPAPTRSSDAPARLEAALRASIRDCLTAPSAVVFMSGGLDSTTLATLAREVAPEVKLLAATSVYRTRIPDVEERYAIEAARSLGIDIRLFPLDGYDPLQALDDGTWTADPGALLSAPMSRDIHAAAAKHAPVAMHGHPADAVLEPALAPYLRGLGFFERIAALVRYTLVKRRPPYFFFRDLLGWPRRRVLPAPLPNWLRARPRPRGEKTSPLESPIWSNYFEWAHPSVTHAPIELVYPWFDVRVVEAALAMPPIPWLVDKHVLRELLRGRISETIRRRKKTFVSGDPWSVALPLSRPLEIEAAARYVDPGRFVAALRDAPALSNMALRAVALEYWLRELPSRVRALRGVNRA
jgi:asparagine synthase (glutamine-hydrolysing)